MVETILDDAIIQSVEKSLNIGKKEKKKIFVQQAISFIPKWIFKTFPTIFFI
jgi:hypothetical protein